MLLGLWMTNALQVYFYKRMHCFGHYEKMVWFRIVDKIYIILVTLVICYKLIWSTANLIGMKVHGMSYLHWSVLYPEILPFGQFIEKMFMLLIAILPIPMKIWIAPQLRAHCVKITLNFDSKYNDKSM